jgi:hypothetical protein
VPQLGFEALIQDIPGMLGVKIKLLSHGNNTTTAVYPCFDAGENDNGDPFIFVGTKA